jgi:hypothetical protein
VTAISNNHADDYQRIQDFLTDGDAMDSAFKTYKDTVKAPYKTMMARKAAAKEALRPLHDGLEPTLNLSSPNTRYEDAPSEMVAAAKRFAAKLGAISKRNPLIAGKPTRRAASNKFIDLLRDWFSTNDASPNSAAMSYFSGANRSTVYNAVHRLKEEGFDIQIDKDSRQYVCISRPATESDEVAQVRAELAKMQAKFDALQERLGS